MEKKILSFLCLIFLLQAGGLYGQKAAYEKNRIQPWKENPRFWQYKGKPVMLLGGSNDDNLFQWPSDLLIPHLNSMKKIGANYIRNTMSDRKDLGFEVYPFKQLENGKYDLNQWNEEYWKRFETLLKETAKRKIIVQIELWDRFDYSQEFWATNPYNPKNNINYSYEESTFAKEYPEHANRNRQPFFFTTPGQRNNLLLLPIQQKFIERVLSYTLQHDHVLYCIDNETSGEEAWSTYWRDFITEKANKSEKNICVTEMWEEWDLLADRHKRTFDHPARFQFCDISQNTHQRGDKLWNNFQWVLRYIEASPRPVNIVKTYGADGGRHGNTKDAIERWWLHLLGGAASVRFHRPDTGLGLSDLSISSIRAARKLESIAKPWELQPSNSLLIDRKENQAYLTRAPGKAYVVFLPNGGSIQLDLKGDSSKFAVRYLNIRTGEWHGKWEPAKEITQATQLSAPGSDEWLIVVVKK